MSIPMNADCLLCHFSRHVKKAQALGDEQTAFAFSKVLMRMYLEAPEGVSSPWFSPQVEKLFQEYYGLEGDQYADEKQQANRFVMERLELVRQAAQAAEDPILAGLQFSILGNYLDFAALQGQVSFEKLEQMLLQALDMKLDGEVYQSLRNDLAKGKKLLYITDNAGEIAMDRIFAEQIAAAYPQLEILFCVRGGNTLNDATREDAALVELPFPVIDNGNLVSGTELTLLGPEAKEAFATADVILSKGMANTETLYGCGHNIYYAFLVKCVHFVQIFGQPMFTPMLIKERK